MFSFVENRIQHTSCFLNWVSDEPDSGVKAVECESHILMGSRTEADLSCTPATNSGKCRGRARICWRHLAVQQKSAWSAAKLARTTLNMEQLLLKKPFENDSIGGGWWLLSFAWDTVLSGNRSNLVEFLWSFLWHVDLSSCQECARGVLPERALDHWLQPGAAGGQHGAALRPWLRGWRGPRAPLRPRSHHRTPGHWGERLCLPPLTLRSCFAQWE